MSGRAISDDDYRRLLEFRDGVRRFLHWSQDQARAVGLTAAQHQLLLAVRGHDTSTAPTIGDVAAHLLVRHHSAVELVGRAEAAGLLARQTDDQDHRVVRLSLTELGSHRLSELSALHLEELRRMRGGLSPLWADLP
jgi:DNA-binding MarR family transcriptional regulator